MRFIGNFSSGKMGCAIANELALLGANVELVIGPSSADIHPNISVHRVESTKEMYDSCLEKFKNSELVIFSAAVSDYKAKIEKKRKKSQGRCQT